MPAFIDQSKEHDGVCLGRIKCPLACVQVIPTADRLQASSTWDPLKGCCPSDLGNERVQGSLAKDRQLACSNSPGNFSALCLVAAELVRSLGPKC